LDASDHLGVEKGREPPLDVAELFTIEGRPAVGIQLRSQVAKERPIDAKRVQVVPVDPIIELLLLELVDAGDPVGGRHRQQAPDDRLRGVRALDGALPQGGLEVVEVLLLLVDV